MTERDFLSVCQRARRKHRSVDGSFMNRENIGEIFCFLEDLLRYVGYNILCSFYSAIDLPFLSALDSGFNNASLLQRYF